MRTCWLLGRLLGGLLAAAFVHGGATTASLLLSAVAARPGETVWAAVRLQMKEDWHIYWRNPGESGLATSIEWTLPAGITAGDILWPTPDTVSSGGLTTFVYHQEVSLLVPLTVASNASPGKVTLKAKTEWLECLQACVPGKAKLEATLEVGTDSRPAATAADIKAWLDRIPRPDADLKLTTALQPGAKPDEAKLVVGGANLAGVSFTDFYPYEGTNVEVALTATAVPSQPGSFSFTKDLKRLSPAWPPHLAGLLVQANAEGHTTRAIEVRLALADKSAPPTPAQPTAATSPPAASSTSFALLLQMLGLAFLGGFILNFMPCVLPVIALKVLGFVQHSKEAPGEVKRLGLVYAVGVLVSFMALAFMVILVQQAGQNASWGMQMQNPYFRLALVVIVFLVALNLFGVFEVSLSGRALDTAAQLSARQGTAGAFFNGVLATVLATPCTAPFLAVALGFAFTQPSWVVLLIFASTALGLASLYVALSWNPAWLKLLPRPGAWMSRFKTLMGFPMLATMIWLLDLTHVSFGEDGLLWLSLFLLTLGTAAWVYGEFLQRNTQRRALAGAVVLALLAFAYFYLLERQLNWRSPSKPLATLGPQSSPEGIAWQAWSPEAVTQARAQGHPVLVDFTAKWCLTCKANKRLAIEIPKVADRLRQMNAVALRADNTDPNEAIAAELKRFGRAGVPLVLVYPVDPAKPPLVLPTLLTEGLVLQALHAAAP